MRGSRKHILDWVEQRTFVDDLMQLALPAPATATDATEWAPLGHSRVAEARLDLWCPPSVGPPDLRDTLGHWWLLHRRGANTPNWDLACVVDIEGTNGLILVEAKAHAAELDSRGKPTPRASANSSANHGRIACAVDQARQGLARLCPDICISTDRHYQLSNRLAFMWKLAELGVPVILIYLGFIGDRGMRGHLQTCSQWHSLVDDAFRSVGALKLLEHRRQLGGAPFWVLCRDRPVLRQSPEPKPRRRER